MIVTWWICFVDLFTSPVFVFEDFVSFEIVLVVIWKHLKINSWRYSALDESSSLCFADSFRKLRRRLRRASRSTVRVNLSGLIDCTITDWMAQSLATSKFLALITCGSLSFTQFGRQSNGHQRTATTTPLLLLLLLLLPKKNNKREMNSFYTCKAGKIFVSTYVHKKKKNKIDFLSFWASHE